MKRKKRIQWYSVILLAFSLTACQVKRPETVIPDAKMENVLYDFHIAKAMGESEPSSIEKGLMPMASCSPKI